MPTPKIIVLDDDPTGSQTVHSCLLLMRWDVETLLLGLRDAAPIFFVLTNTRAMTAENALHTTREVCQNLKQALAIAQITDFLIVSRSDSTLRGHYPVETDAIAQELGSFDAHFLTPAFFEGGRFTKDSVHYLMVNGVPTPVHETEFAKDSVFAFSHSYLPDYVEEKTEGKIKATQVERILLEDVRSDQEALRQRLIQFHDNQCAVVDAETQEDLNQFAAAILAAASQGKRFLFRSAASLLTALAALPPQPVPSEDMASYTRNGKPGAVIVGSHVQKTTEQFEELLKAEAIVGIEIEVSRLLEDLQARSRLLQEALEQVHAAHAEGKTPVIYTSRQELSFDDVQTRLDFGTAVSDLLMDIEKGLPADIGFLISKGGITSNDTLSNGLALTAARLLGQILPGVSVIITPDDHPQFPKMPVVLFPGNVGDRHALAAAYQRLRGKG
ncbi:MAG: four-carbon acid sugar kinase family protein [Drouetiella hepatica Uher 2000/2452]|jgi:uncharacterized protein YgbK (DUF1537 family)|uniref:Four-carbon acid sugar kinase family protein n=1 Tax=Drouetiella hepatica Uher 2000/2452 TaxID=904376 RepID=A0A951Q7M7_9CYAN|nr:four-carbon acid sugar kinase family protein [Drouetiella hepatica Uher 2000/2452]